MNQIFLPVDQLGLILPAFQRIQLLTTKRQKATAMKSFCSTLKGLGLVKKTLNIHSVALGCEVDGSYGLFINWRDSLPVHVAGQTGPAQAEGPTARGQVPLTHAEAAAACEASILTSIHSDDSQLPFGDQP